MAETERRSQRMTAAETGERMRRERRGSGVKYTDAVEREIELRRKEAEAKREQDKANVSERMKKMAAGTGTAPGFSTASLGAQIAAAAAAGGSRKVKDIAKAAEGGADA
eukprot:CAMPEP_0202035820 /NCGR_PEP_ID=MMETSP0962-20130828/1158_1 /ASSEMBLY_ACC=CAM_ASM_000488 /TAXON_ID=4773 /ORGANISM="Schizochytrium aggregatum, Strain ATCC28209" /LENGTH=108 /DNA_ID=CAMNT_0048599863 /DNA_START=28 /DNA_END=354 /DNA_ORIENTATION=+